MCSCSTGIRLKYQIYECKTRGRYRTATAEHAKHKYSRFLAQHVVAIHYPIQISLAERFQWLSDDVILWNASCATLDLEQGNGTWFNASKPDYIYEQRLV